MKKAILYSAMALATTLGMSSCGDDFLLLEPAGTASENALLSENGIDMALTGVYSTLNNMNQTGWMGYASLANYCFGDVAGADANKGSQSSDQSLLRCILSLPPTLTFRVSGLLFMKLSSVLTT